jgi:hypothetical protein
MGGGGGGRGLRPAEGGGVVSGQSEFTMSRPHKTHNIQYRIHNTETHVHKITNVPVFLHGAWT